MGRFCWNITTIFHILSLGLLNYRCSVIVWTAESEKYRFPLRTDTFVMRNGKIIAQTFAAKIEPKKIKLLIFNVDINNNILIP